MKQRPSKTQRCSLVNLDYLKKFEKLYGYNNTLQKYSQINSIYPEYLQDKYKHAKKMAACTVLGGSEWDAKPNRTPS